MASRDAWLKARSLLRMVYGKLANDDTLKALHATLDDLSDDVLIDALGRHIDNSEQNGASLAGEWCPKPAQVRFHANALHVEAEKARADALVVAQEKLRETALTTTNTVAFPAGGAFGLKSVLELEPTSCSECRDSGYAYYYVPRDRSHPANKYRLYMAAEYLELPEAMQRHYERYPAVCDCAVGQLKRQAAPDAHTTGVGAISTGRPRRIYITVEEARKMSAARKAKVEAVQ